MKEPLARWPTAHLRTHTIERGISSAELAERLGLTLCTFRRLVGGGDRLTTRQAERICEELGVEPSSVWADWTERLELRIWEPMPWARRGRCRGEDANFQFFGNPGERPEMARAREQLAIATYCDPCPVQAECRAYGRANREYGVWGGETELERAAAGYGPLLPIGMVAKVAREVRVYGTQES
jgi:WhiB family redox-sensing transcriptional regulator